MESYAVVSTHLLLPFVKTHTGTPRHRHANKSAMLSTGYLSVQNQSQSNDRRFFPRRTAMAADKGGSVHLP